MDRPTVNSSAALLPAVVRPAVEDRRCLSSDHCAGPVLDLLNDLGWAVVDTPEGNEPALPAPVLPYQPWRLPCPTV